MYKEECKSSWPDEDQVIPEKQAGVGAERACYIVAPQQQAVFKVTSNLGAEAEEMKQMEKFVLEAVSRKTSIPLSLVQIAFDRVKLRSTLPCTVGLKGTKGVTKEEESQQTCDRQNTGSQGEQSQNAKDAT